MIKIGLDFDGVVTYNPLRIARVVVSFIKHRVFKIKKLGFFVPKSALQRLIYRVGVVWPSYFPAAGLEKLRQMAISGKYEFYLITGRYGFVKHETYRWLDKYHLTGMFGQIFMNEDSEQPHVYKRRIIKSNNFDYFIEDNIDIVRDLTNCGVKTKIYWIYNISDSLKTYRYKFPYLKKALEKIDENSF